jgi:hypothetical protein
MINKLKEETQKLIFDLKEDMKAIKWAQREYKQTVEWN